jgi:hypothetical protein
MTKIHTFLVGQSCRSALNYWAAQQRRPTDDVKIFVLHLPAHFPLNYVSVHAPIMANPGTNEKPTVVFLV